MVDPGDEQGLLQWTLRTRDGGTELPLNIGPSEGGAPQYPKNIILEGQNNPSPVTTVLMEAGAPVPTIVLSGTVLNNAQVQVLYDVANTTAIMELIDDLDRHFAVYPQSLDVKRTLHPSHPQMHTYTLQLMVLDGRVPDLP